MSRLITQKYANEQVVEIDAMFQELWNTNPKFRAWVTAKDNLDANYRYTKKFVIDAIDSDGISNDTRVYVNGIGSRFHFKDWVGTITNVKKEKKIREAHLRKSFPKLGADL